MNTYLNSFIHTLKEPPKDAEVISHQLMVRAGLIRKVASGVYSILPLGQRVFKKMTQIIHEEMSDIGASECDLPHMVPAELWKLSKRWDQYGKELLRISDRSDREFCFGPTHEEVITDLVNGYVNSYKQLQEFQIHLKNHKFLWSLKLKSPCDELTEQWEQFFLYQNLLNLKR